MKKTDAIVKILSLDIVDRSILEVACGCAELSISAAPTAKSVTCIDIEEYRVPPVLPTNVCFSKMDACDMSYSDDLFDTVIMYNAFAHVYPQWEPIKKECLRVLKPKGCFYIISTWNLDVSLMNEVFEDRMVKCKDFHIVKLEKV